MTAILASMFFGAISGSSPATVVAIGALLYPAMIEKGYSREFSAGVITAAGSLGIIIPPSVNMIVYGTVTGASVGALFMSGFGAGIVYGLSFVVYTFFYAKRHPEIQRETRKTWGERLVAIKESIWGMGVPIIILGGIYSGIFTPTESAVVAAVYGIIVAMFVYRELTPKGLWESVKETMSITGRLGIIWAVSTAYGEVMAMYQIPSMLSEWLMSITRNPYVIWLLICIFLTFMGCIMNSMSQVIIFTPIFAPVVQAVGIDLMHFAIIFVLNAEIGFLTPPLGTNLFVAMDQAKCSLGEISKAVIPFILFLFLMMAILIILPQISLWLPQTFLSV